MKQINIVVACIGIALLAASCKGEIELPDIPVRSISILQRDQALTVGQSVKLSVDIQPINAADKTVKWSSSDEDVVMVSAEGKAKALSAGEVQITAEAGGRTDFITIKVSEEEVVVEAPELSITVGAENITAVSAVLKGQAKLESSEGVTVGFQYSRFEDMLPFNSISIKVGEMDADYNYSQIISGLNPDTEYYYRSVLLIDGEEYYGRIEELKTKNIASLLITDSAPSNEMDCREAVLYGTLDLTNVDYSSIAYGFIWGKVGKEGARTKEADGLNGQTFYASIEGLAHETQYWYKSFVTIDGQTIYGEQKDFTTPEYTIGAINLGLSVKWADGNVGANSPEDYGDYFAWGEVEPHYLPGYSQSDSPEWRAGKQGYIWDTYDWTTDGYNLSKYNTLSEEGVVDNRTTLELQDDAARRNLGEPWRMPIKEEMEELLENCSWEWTVTENGVRGALVTGPNGNQIFLPASGDRYYSNFFDSEFGRYWSSSLKTDETESAWFLQFGLDSGSEFFEVTRVYRYWGLAVRAVKE